MTVPELNRVVEQPQVFHTGFYYALLTLDSKGLQYNLKCQTKN